MVRSYEEYTIAIKNRNFRQTTNHKGLNDFCYREAIKILRYALRGYRDKLVAVLFD